jgi:hypothetical protein
LGLAAPIVDDVAVSWCLASVVGVTALGLVLVLVTDAGLGLAALGLLERAGLGLDPSVGGRGVCG